MDVPETITEVKASPRVRLDLLGLFLTTVWFGFVTGWLELGLFLAKRLVNPHIPMDLLRTNRHFAWMIPASNALIFGAVGLLMALLAWLLPGLARWLAWRLPIALAFMALLLNIDGLYVISAVVLSLGLGSCAGPFLARRAAVLGRLIQFSLPLLAVGLVVQIGVNYQRVISAERRALAACPMPTTPDGPNVLLLVLDDVRAASLSLYGHNRPTTPNLERLARKGIVFSEARPTAPWTLPSHASLFTGRWPHELSVGWDLPLDATYPTLAESLAGHGYATAGFVGNTFYGNALYGLGRGFARYEDNYENQTASLFEMIRSSSLGKRIVQTLGYSIRVAEGGTALRKTAAMLNRDVLGWLAKRPAWRPFFVFVNYYDAHGPFVPPEAPTPRFGLGALPNVDQVKVLKTYQRLMANKLTPADGTPAQIEQQTTDVFRDSYESCIAYLDHQIGLLFDELERRGLLENTLVIVTSDHGEQFREHGFFGHGRSLYRPEVHIPLLIFPPGFRAPGRTVAEPVSLRDIPATVLDQLGIEEGVPFPGRSLAPLWDDQKQDSALPSSVLSEVEHQTNSTRMLEVPATLGPVKSLVSGGQVYIRNGDGREELFDLKNDPLDMRNLADAPQSRPVLDRFRGDLERALSKTPHQGTLRR